MAVEYVRSANESPTPRYPQPSESSESIPIGGQPPQPLGAPSLRGSAGNPYHDFRSGRTSLDRPVPKLYGDTSQDHRRQSLQLGFDRRTSLAAEIEQPMRRSSLPNPTPEDLKLQKKRVVGNGVYKPETLPWHESSLRQAMARRANEKKDQLAPPPPLINLRPEAEARLRDVLGEEGYTEWRQKHRVSYLLNEG
jgi:hypothetical protein